MIKEATLSDRPEFMRLFMEYLIEERKNGSHLRDSIHNLNYFRKYFDAYTVGSLFGACILWYPDDDPIPRGMALTGEQWEPNSWDSDLGRVCIIWGLYVEPEHRGKGISLQLGEFGIKRGMEIGFDTVQTSVLEGNQKGAGASLKFGTKPYGTYHIASIKQLCEQLKEK